MRTWKIVLAFVALSSAPVLARVHHGSKVTTGVGSKPTTGVAAGHRQPRHSMPVRSGHAEIEHGWGPVRRTDW